MATDKGTVSYIVDQLSAAGEITAKPMFGEHGLYCDGKLFALICDRQLFFKPTPGGRALADGCAEAAPYPGAKPCLLIDPERWDDRDWLAVLVAVTATALPAPRPKAPRKLKRS
jgi:TfoX/Sxy family transcriptional regulator of competence genes